MKTPFILAALLLAQGAAQAGSVAIDINGQTVHIKTPHKCNDISCVSITAPGFSSDDLKNGKTDLNDLMSKFMPKNESDDAEATDATKPSAVVPPAVTATAPAPSAVAPAMESAKIDVPASRPMATASTSATADLTSSQPLKSEPPKAVAPQLDAVKVDPKPAPSATVATLEERPAVAAPVDPTSPLGLWATEKNEGVIHIVACGANLCGYKFDTETKADGVKILINMKPVDAKKWSGTIHDPVKGGTYASTLSMKGPQTLRVQGCAFGGMICGGQTWTRI